jgi:hypothetical protein
MFGGRLMKLQEVADRFALNEIFYEFPWGGTLDDLQKVADGCESFFESDEWILAEDYQPYAYISSGAILQLVYDKAWHFKRYYEMVGE